MNTNKNRKADAGTSTNTGAGAGAGAFGTVPRTGSIAKRLNHAIIRRRLFVTLIMDILIAGLVISTWCMTVEKACGGSFNTTYARAFTGYEAVPENVSLIIDSIAGDKLDVTGITEEPDSLIFDGTVYTFKVGEHTYYHNASVILSAVTTMGVLLLIIQLIMTFVRVFTGRSFIKKFLRPIDDIAISAERISAMSASLTDSAKKPDSEEVQSLAHAINEIDDSDDRVTVHDSELGGLEAALNNMLKRLEESKRKQIRFVDDASHELRTPIAVIQGYVNMLDRWGKDDPKITEEAVSAIKTEADHMKTLIDQLLFLARGEMDRHELTMMPLDAGELLAQVTEESEMIDSDHDYEYIPEPPDTPHELTINADPTMMKQAIRILTDNAAKYTPAGGNIKLRAYGKEGYVYLDVSDNGVGIAADELPRIFDRFYRGRNMRGDSNSGSGLGLSIAKWIIDEHGGRIEAISGEGIGTRMSIRLKLAERKDFTS